LTFQPGQSGNPAGRKPGAYTKRNEELFQRLEKRGDRDPGDILSEIASDANERKDLRIQAATALMPYRYAKHGLLPAPPPLVFVAETVELPHPACTHIEHTIANIEHVSALRRTGKLDQDTADRLVAEQRIIRDGLIEAAKLEAEHGPRETTVRIEGGV
jgi:hypothetical protein